MKINALFLLSLLFPSLGIALPISEIRFEGNTSTRESVLRQELHIHEGEESDSQRIEASRQAIMNLGLFKLVTSRLEQDGPSQQLIFTVEERYYLLPIPLIGGNQEEGNYNYGLELRHDNLWGLNHRLKVVYENEKTVDDTLPLKREAKFNYSIPRFINTPYALGLQAGRVTEKVIELDDSLSFVTGSYHQQVDSRSFSLARWIEPKWSSQGWLISGGAGVTEKSYHDQVGSGLLYQDSQTVTLNMGLGFNQVAEHPYHRDGTRYGYTLSIAQPRFGSDYSFTRHWLYYRRYQPLETIDANINSQLRLGVANGEAFSSPTYSIGNSSLLRGYENDYAKGNALFLLNMEYHQHITGYRQLRGVLFADMGNAWNEGRNIDIGDLHSGVGVGMRWRVQSFVDVTLRFDYARALSYDNNTLSLTTSASF
ncbi:MAG: BamA/TamA family outer membrane protein [Chromatiales bacterium]|nr:BamA/TamA family outer membrane protein [Chromatiales bacterium]